MLDNAGVTDRDCASVPDRPDRLWANHQHASSNRSSTLRNPSQRDPEGKSQKLALQLHALSSGKFYFVDSYSFVRVEFGGFWVRLLNTNF